MTPFYFGASELTSDAKNGLTDMFATLRLRERAGFGAF
jgi:hypothetical protein